MITLHQNVAKCQNTLTVLTQKWMIFLQDIWMGQMRMTDAGTTQDNFILPAPPVGRLPISQDWLDRMKLTRNRTISIILPSGKNILVDTMFKIIIGYTNLGMRQTQCRLGSRVCPFITPNANMAGYPINNDVFFDKIKETHFRITIPIKGCSSFIDCKAWRHERESVKTMYLDAT